jgi:hypothetical protein
MASRRDAMRRIVLAAALAALVATAAAQDEKKPESPAAPFNPVEKAEVGDWLAYRATVKDDKNKEVTTVLLEVTKVAGDDVTVKSTESMFEQVFSKKKTCTLHELTGAPSEAPITDVKVKDDKKKVGDKEFACKLVTFKIGGTDPVEASLWLSPDVKVNGLVAMDGKGTGKENAALKIELEIVGYGAKDKTTWGKSRADVEKVQKDEKEQREKAEKEDKK